MKGVPLDLPSFWLSVTVSCGSYSRHPSVYFRLDLTLCLSFHISWASGHSVLDCYACAHAEKEEIYLEVHQTYVGGMVRVHFFSDVNGEYC